MKILVVLLMVVAVVTSAKDCGCTKKAKPPKCNAEKCLYAEAMQNEYDANFYDITCLKGFRSSGYIVNFAFYVKAQRDAHILLTRVAKAIRGNNEYEIVIGGWGGTQTVIRRVQQSQQPLASVLHGPIISSDSWTEFLLQITTEGAIRLFRNNGNSYTLIIVANDSEPLPVEYISFGSWETNLVEFYFGYKFDNTIKCGCEVMP